MASGDDVSRNQIYYITVSEIINYIKSIIARDVSNTQSAGVGRPWSAREPHVLRILCTAHGPFIWLD